MTTDSLCLSYHPERGRPHRASLILTIVASWCALAYFVLISPYEAPPLINLLSVPSFSALILISFAAIYGAFRAETSAPHLFLFAWMTHVCLARFDLIRPVIVGLDPPNFLSPDNDSDLIALGHVYGLTHDEVRWLLLGATIVSAVSWLVARQVTRSPITRDLALTLVAFGTLLSASHLTVAVLAGLLAPILPEDVALAVLSFLAAITATVSLFIRAPIGRAAVSAGLAACALTLCLSLPDGVPLYGRAAMYAIPILAIWLPGTSGWFRAGKGPHAPRRLFPPAEDPDLTELLEPRMLLWWAVLLGPFSYGLYRRCARVTDHVMGMSTEPYTRAWTKGRAINAISLSAIYLLLGLTAVWARLSHLLTG